MRTGGGDKELSKSFKSLRVQMFKHSLSHQILEGGTRGSSWHLKRKRLVQTKGSANIHSGWLTHLLHYPRGETG